MIPLNPPDVTLGQTLDGVVRELKLSEPEPTESEEPIAVRRRRRGTLRGSNLASVSLVRIDGVLRWAYHRPHERYDPRARRAGMPWGCGIVHSFCSCFVSVRTRYRELGIDGKLTPNRGLLR